MFKDSTLATGPYCFLKKPNRSSARPCTYNTLIKTVKGEVNIMGSAPRILEDTCRIQKVAKNGWRWMEMIHAQFPSLLENPSLTKI